MRKKHHFKTGRHDIAEILLKVALKHQKSNQIKSSSLVPYNSTLCNLMFNLVE
jgi:hypothetical protein